MLKSYEPSARFSRGIGLGLRDPYPVKTLQLDAHGDPGFALALLPRAQRSGGVRILWSTAGRTTERFPAALRKQKRISENYDFFDSAHGAVHYPKDRRFRIWIRPDILLGITVVAVSAILAAWIEFALVGSPSVPPVPQIYPNNFAGPYGFPLLLEDPWRVNPVTGKASSLHCDDRSPPSQDSLLEMGLLS